MKSSTPVRVAYLAGAAGDWGGASRVLFTNLRLLDRERVHPLVLLPGEGPIVEELNARGIEYLFWGNVHEFENVGQYLRAIATSLSMFRSHGIQVFHLNDSNYWRPAEILAARLLRIPIITHYHIVMKKVGPFVKYCKIIVANSNFTAKESMPETVPKQVIYNCVDLKRFQSGRALRDELGIAQGLVVIAFAGQIRRIKGIDSFIKLAHRIDSPNVRFLIAGRCHDPQVLPGFYTEDELRWAIRNDSRIMYLGYRLDMENVYATSDIVVMPSTWDEPFGLVNIEAGAAAVPVVATAVGGIPEIIEHGVTGFLVARDDVDELAHYTKMLVDDPQRRGQMGKAARSLVEARFNHAPIRELEQLYVDLCA